MATKQVFDDQNGINFPLQVPDTITLTDIVKNIVPAAIAGAINLAGQGIIATSAVVQILEKTKAQIVYYTLVGEFCNEDTSPAIALGDVYDEALGIVSKRGYDPIIETKLRSHLLKKFDERLTNI